MATDPFANPKTARRDSAGLIATLSDGYVVHIEGLVGPAVRELCDVADARGAKVRAISTPRTIARDLIAERVQFSHGADLPTVHYPEIGMLGKAGRTDLFAA